MSLFDKAIASHRAHRGLEDATTHERRTRQEELDAHKDELEAFMATQEPGTVLQLPPVDTEDPDAKDLYLRYEESTSKGAVNATAANNVVFDGKEEGVDLGLWHARLDEGLASFAEEQARQAKKAAAGEAKKRKALEKRRKEVELLKRIRAAEES